MKIFTFTMKKNIRILIALAFIILISIGFLIESTQIVDVFSEKKELPIYYVESDSKKASITFDCAWGADDIPDILNTLKKENVKATFFIIGQWAEKYSDMVRLISEDGHDIANHSYSHLRMSQINIKKTKSEIIKCDDILTSLTGKKVDLFRAPYGDYNDNLVKTAQELGYYTIQWNVDSLDWKPGITQDEIISRINSKIKPGSIILFHNDTKHTAKILSTIITSLKGKGYDFYPVSQMLLKENYEIDFDGKQMRKK